MASLLSYRPTTYVGVHRTEGNGGDEAKPEIDFQKATWTITAERMKMGASHRISLSVQAIKILKNCQGFDDKLIFPSNTHGKPMSDMVFSALYKRMDIIGVTTHGFRSSFRDWCSDDAKVSREVSEAALAHVRGDMTERAYARSDLFERRRKLMGLWSDFCFQSNDL